MALFDAIGETNALVANNRVPQSRIEPIRLARIHRLIQTILDGPDYIIVKRNKRDFSKLSGFQLEARIVRRSSGVRESWAINTNCDKVPGLVLRHVKVNDKDIQEAKANGVLPEISIISRYLTQEFYEPLADKCQQLDVLLRQGNLPQPADTMSGSWTIYGLYRIGPTFGIELNWNSMSTSPQLEASISALAALIEETLSKHKKQRSRRIQLMEFVYDNPAPDAISILTEA